MPETLSLKIRGLHCASCVARAEKALKAVPGVTDARVNFATASAQADVARQLDPKILGQALRSAGFEAIPDHTPRNLANEQAETLRGLRRDTILAAALATPLFLVEMGGHLYPPFHHWVMAAVGWQTSWWAQFVLGSAVIFGPGRRFLRTGLPALWRRTANMNSLVALGTLAAWGYSTAALVVPEIFPAGTRAIYFEAAAVIVTLILLGRLLEACARGRAGEAIRQLATLRPKEAEVKRAGTFVRLPAAAVRAGDVVRVRPGACIPADGQVTAGASRVHEAMLTGEPAPKARGVGDSVTGGTLNGTGTLTVKVLAAGAESVLAQIIAMVEQAQDAKLPVQGIIDRVTAIFVPVVIGLAALTTAVWAIIDPALAIITGVSVLIIACPCALGLATPISIVIAIGRAARLGAWFRRGEALQVLATARVVAFDKTGTLTVGHPAGVAVRYAPGRGAQDVLAPVAGVEILSEHPLARVIARYAARAGVVPATATGFRAVPGKGACARVDGRSVLVGSAAFLREHGADPAGIAAPAGTAAPKVFAAIDGTAVAAFEISDVLRPNAADTIAHLKKQGLHVALISGDTAAGTGPVAARLGITDVNAGILPGEKQDAVRRLRAAHGPVIFVGDGINDAPALAEADIGIAMGCGTDIAAESADVVLPGSDLAAVARAFQIAKAGMRNIRQNLFWAFAYNAALIPLSAGIAYPLLLSPMLAAGAMAASSVCVVANALRLRKAGL
ncbi:MAG: cadmium-translocating P-type ATPase [Rhodobacteraceae bacterium]|nr:cadmium-translocating P-type ATPase [Paracoccaceae bacterium]